MAFSRLYFFRFDPLYKKGRKFYPPYTKNGQNLTPLYKKWPEFYPVYKKCQNLVKYGQNLTPVQKWPEFDPDIYIYIKFQNLTLLYNVFYPPLKIDM